MAVTTNHIFIFGASCSGKSTLALALKESLGHQWTYLDRDELIDKGECTDETANALLDQKLQQIKNRTIVDAQIPWREKQERELYFLVLPPLEILLKRDAQRTKILQRTPQRAEYAREYVIQTYQTLASIDRKHFDAHFDSSQSSVAEETQAIKGILI